MISLKVFMIIGSKVIKANVRKAGNLDSHGFIILGLKPLCSKRVMLGKLEILTCMDLSYLV